MKRFSTPLSYNSPPIPSPIALLLKSLREYHLIHLPRSFASCRALSHFAVFLSLCIRHLPTAFNASTIFQTHGTSSLFLSISLVFCLFQMLRLLIGLLSLPSIVRLSHAYSDSYPSYSALSRSSNTSSSIGTTITAAPTLSCYPQNQDPDQGILSAFCICNETVSLPQLTPIHPQAFEGETESCSYTTIPVS